MTEKKLILFFRPTGQGKILCERFNSAGEYLDQIVYNRGSSPALKYLGAANLKSWERAYDVEFGRAEKLRELRESRERIIKAYYENLYEVDSEILRLETGGV